MDRFAERRFGPFSTELSHGDAARLPSFPYRHDILSGAVFDTLAPARLRWVADDRGRLKVAGRQATRLIGRSEAALHGRRWRAFVHPADRRLLIAAALGSHRPDPVRLRLRQADGSWCWTLNHLRFDRDADGRECWHGVTTDIHALMIEEQDRLAKAVEESDAHYRWAVALNPQLPWTASPEGEIEEIGPRWLHLTGEDPDRAKGRGWVNALHPDDRPGVEAAWAQSVATATPVDVRYRIRLPDGSYRWMRARAAPRLDDHGNIFRWYGTLDDVHDQHLSQAALAESEERFRLAVQSANLGIWDYDAATRTRTWSPELKAMLGVSPDAEPTNELALALVHPDDRSRLSDIMASVSTGAAPDHFEATLRIRRADTGETRWLKSTGWNGVSAGSDLSRLVVTFQDVTEQRDAERRIRWAATHDPLTGLRNRALWQEALEDFTRKGRANGAHFGLMLLDVDDLKRTNDTLGHDGGDALLRNFAARIMQWAPDDAIVGRLGGDEFAVIAPSLADPAAVERCATDLRKRLAVPFMHDGRHVECNASIGASVFPDHGEEAAELLKAADLALYATKARGRGQLTIFHSQLRAETQQRASMISMAREALEEDLIVPFYQPKVDLRTGRILGYEALLRWRHPRLGLQGPASILAAFETPQVAIALTERMMTLVTADMRNWIDAGVDCGRVAVNASASDFSADDFAERVLDHLARHNVPPDFFEVEVTETVFLGRGGDNVKRALTKLSANGIRIALDDFGTGYASLSHLKQFPVDVLKIDRSFVNDIGHDRSDTAIVDAIVNLGVSMNLDVVAEGVETQAQAALLLEQGCFIGQGFLLGRPIAREAIT
ncbi:EAL domain-containing protein [Sphingobium sp. AN641]|uniref:sensor domain-containing protein n=1 Tax=Sphingobium sp. AN641 TaxID=3133443 RepID=UPI0030C079D3